MLRRSFLAVLGGLSVWRKPDKAELRLRVVARLAGGTLSTICAEKTLEEDLLNFCYVCGTDTASVYLPGVRRAAAKVVIPFGEHAGVTLRDRLTEVAGLVRGAVVTTSEAVGVFY